MACALERVEQTHEREGQIKHSDQENHGEKVLDAHWRTRPSVPVTHNRTHVARPGRVVRLRPGTAFR